MTKCGRFGAADFDYSPKTLRACVQRSLRRLHTTYLDTVYLHDVEFIAEAMSPTSVKFHTAALSDEAELYGLQLGNEAMIQGPGDQMVLDGLSELRKMQEEGLIKHIGITGLVHLSFTIDAQARFRVSLTLLASPGNPSTSSASLQTA